MSHIKMPCHLSKTCLVVTSFLGLISLLLAGCLQKSSPVNITFEPRYNNTILSCQTGFIHDYKQTPPIASQNKWQYQQLQFFLHDVEIKTIKNGWQPWLMTTSAFQSNNVALLGEVCAENNKHSNWQLELDPLIDSVQITDLRFTLGVPFSLNHLNPLTQPSPLNASSMFWPWQGGHKFMRLELNSANDDWLFHLGSTGCKALSPVRAPNEECLQPNRIEISLPFSKKTGLIELDLSKLLNNLLLTRENSCQSAVDDEGCKVLFNNLGLSAKNIIPQSLFKVQRYDK